MPNRPRARRRGAWSLVSSPQRGGPAPHRTRGSRDLKTRRADGRYARGTPRRWRNHRVPRGMCPRTCVSVVQIVNGSLRPNSHRVPLASVRHAACVTRDSSPPEPPPRLYPVCRLTVVTPPRSSSSARVGSASRATIKSGRPQSALTWEVVLLAVDHHRTSPEAAFYGLCKLPTIASEHVGSLFVQRIVGIRLQHQKLQPHDDR